MNWIFIKVYGSKHASKYKYFSDIILYHIIHIYTYIYFFLRIYIYFYWHEDKNINALLFTSTCNVMLIKIHRYLISRSLICFFFYFQRSKYQMQVNWWFCWRICHYMQTEIYLSRIVRHFRDRWSRSRLLPIPRELLLPCSLPSEYWVKQKYKWNQFQKTSWSFAPFHIRIFKKLYKIYIYTYTLNMWFWLRK